MPARLRIFLIDNDAKDIELTTEVLRQHADITEVHTCPGGFCASDSEVMAALEGLSQPPHLILLDIHMPPQSGLDILGHLKTHPRYRLIPVVVRSNSQETVDIAEAYRRHASAYLVKGSDFAAFSEQMSSLVSFYKCCQLLPSP